MPHEEESLREKYIKQKTIITVSPLISSMPHFNWSFLNMFLIFNRKKTVLQRSAVKKDLKDVAE